MTVRSPRRGSSASPAWFDAVVSDERSILSRFTALIEAGRHLDEVPGLPGVALDGGGTFRGDRRLYRRGTDEYADAVARGLLGTPRH